jgi:GAF domain-containing protein
VVDSLRSEALGRPSAGTNPLAERERDFAALMEMSREITATLDLDRVLRATVNLASRVLPFDRGAIALYERGACDIRAVAGADGVDAKNPAVQDLAVRASWAAGRGERFYLSDRADPASDAERTFVHIFHHDLERDRAASGLYLPLKDDEGVVGILMFEAEQVDFASPHQRALAEILANQATVALRNAQLYRQIPMADTLGALAARRDALLAIPLRRRLLYGAAALLVLAALTLTRRPVRIAGVDPVLRPLTSADSLALDMGIEQEDITRVRVGDEVRFRMAALPQQTFTGRVVSIGSPTSGTRFPVRASVANEGAQLRPGMTGYARVLTAPMSPLGQLFRKPIRALRLFWWRMTS